jgi:hypothetical protein
MERSAFLNALKEAKLSNQLPLERLPTRTIALVRRSAATLPMVVTSACLSPVEIV